MVAPRRSDATVQNAGQTAVPEAAAGVFSYDTPGPASLNESFIKP
jgi:hypothetical protein